MYMQLKKQMNQMNLVVLYENSHTSLYKHYDTKNDTNTSL